MDLYRTTLHCSETSVDFYRVAQHYNPQDCNLHCNRCESLKTKNAYITVVWKQNNQENICCKKDGQTEGFIVTNEEILRDI
jgi:hypothetical protein